MPLLPLHFPWTYPKSLHQKAKGSSSHKTQGLGDSAWLLWAPGALWKGKWLCRHCRLYCEVLSPERFILSYLMLSYLYAESIILCHRIIFQCWKAYLILPHLMLVQKSYITLSYLSPKRLILPHLILMQKRLAYITLSYLNAKRLILSYLILSYHRKVYLILPYLI